MIDKSAAMGKVKNQIKTIFHNPLLTGVWFALDNPTKEATNIWDPDNGTPSAVPRNKIAAVGICVAKAVLGYNSVILPTPYHMISWPTLLMKAT